MRRQDEDPGSSPNVRVLPDASGGAAMPDRDDWTARHARTRPPVEERNVRATEPDDDWTARHGRTRRT